MSFIFVVYGLVWVTFMLMIVFEIYLLLLGLTHRILINQLFNFNINNVLYEYTIPTI